MPEVPPLNAEEEQLCYELLQDLLAPHPNSKAESRHPVEEINFRRSYLKSYSFSH